MIWLQEVDSTNNHLKQLVENGAAAGTAVAAGYQTGGRGRLGRSFHSPRGTGMYLSYLFRPEKPVEDCMHLTCACAVAVAEAVEEVSGIAPGIKWPNDLCHDGKKLGGILTEVCADNGDLLWAVVGIGINCNDPEGGFPEEISAIAQSLQALCGREISPRCLAEKVVARLDTLAADLASHRWMEAYRKRCVTTGKEVQVIFPEEVRQAFAQEVDDAGGLVVSYPDGSKSTVTSGEVSVRGIYGYL